MAFIKNVERCRQFYTDYGIPMLEEHFHPYLSYLTTGLAGEGSDCFGYDDPLSTDHDYGIGFCIWMDEDLYLQIGNELQKRYEQICRDYLHAEEKLSADSPAAPAPSLGERRGVMLSRDYYERLLHYRIPSEQNHLTLTDSLWMLIPDSDLAAATNGVLFHQGENQFSQFRAALKNYYPSSIHRLKLAEQVHLFSQNGQYNYPRMMARGDLLTAKLCVMQAIRAAMAVSYLLHRRYAPYDKWMRRGMEDFTLLPELAPLLDHIASLEPSAELWTKISYSSRSVAEQDPICLAFEQTAEMLLDELRHQGFCSGTELFLDVYCNEIAEE